MTVRTVALYDQDCGLCERSVAWLEPRVRDVEFVGMQSQGEQNESLVIRSGSTEWHGELAVAKVLRMARARRWRAVGTVLSWWGVRHLARPVYRWVANHRAQISARMGWQACRVRP